MAILYTEGLFLLAYIYMYSLLSDQIKEKYCTEKMRFLINESFVYANYHLDI